MMPTATLTLFLIFLTLGFHHVRSNTLTPESLPSSPPEQPHRTAFHFQPPQNWMNDPNGPMYYNGLYHLFYQYNPSGPLFAEHMYWAHSVSHDLINWTPLDIAIAPAEPFDLISCWSGSATILPGNKPVMLYTGIDSENRQVQNLIEPKNLSDPYLREWVKYTGNPVINLPDGIQHDDFRDPTTAWLADDGKWRIIVGSQKDKKGIAFLYQSEDFVNWSMHESPLHEVAGTGIWECPDFFPVWVDSTNGVDTSVMNSRVKHVLKVGLFDYQKDYYMIGDYNFVNENYVPQNELTLGTLRYDYGKYYASKSFFDPVKNRRILLAWVNESDSQADDVAKGWSGVHSFPRSIWLDKKQKQLVQWPIKEIETLYENEATVQNKNLEDGSSHEILGITAWQVDVKLSFKLNNLEEAEKLDPSGVDPQLVCSEMDASKKGKFGPFGLLALASHDLTEQTAIFFRVFQNNGRYIVLMCSDQSRSSTRNGLDKTTYGAFVDIDPQQDEISLRTLIDHSIVESFGGGGKTCITARVYPTLAIKDEAHLFAFNNGTESVLITELSAWSVKKARINTEENVGRASQ
ncbi:putative glycosidase [Helianthus annuus]|uniref:Glycosidase n=1 Tax=Helianthus annuus TaxID=4232 RepID=A0A251RLW5_HELAN|nr:fructan 6-exohydrolase [Helianthus annuus]XP_035842584.1 fructan 6-exohydrolase [Helianthus annuus]XP_035842585.1 fructan 6-exohydrolase [Helianthus annuus]XP_035842586.1 fructan 6-exohydrolase [Helianthus annuus]XP_035842587.1 fructan 6-exohydrolase [Helianthus annuus]XP_035842588.1 fructan 6-exohydrolase [Helianthus annuus]XP_035842589.1 fructan 6-exohydrolase [Helianthus annuus]XP_035842590.1 fructan 6-exohydrolase [Helianthus annuus]XP_035842591.1 fructan 6-exohydrolase [Helianthus a